MADDRSAQPTGVAARTSRYADGIYTATGQYGRLPSSMIVRVRLERGVITRVEVGTPATDPTSLRYQKQFAAAVPGVVTGLPIDQVKVGKLAGASGCPDGFNAAMARIRAQATR